MSSRGLSMWAISRWKPSSIERVPMVAHSTAFLCWIQYTFSPGAYCLRSSYS